MSPRGAYLPLHEYAHSSRREDLETGVTRRTESIKLTSPHVPRLSPRSCAIAVATVVCVVVWTVNRHGRQLTWLEQALVGEGLDPSLSFDQLYARSRPGWIEYNSSSSTSTSHGRDDDDDPDPGGLETWVDGLSDACIERVVARGLGQFFGEPACRGSRIPRRGGIDLVWTYSNGSDPLLQVWRAEVTAFLTGKVSTSVSMVRAAKRSKHFRSVPRSAAAPGLPHIPSLAIAPENSDHDELRYSIRSALSSFTKGSLSTLHLLMPDLPFNALLRDTIAPPPQNDSAKSSSPLRLGQIPHWFNQSHSLADTTTHASQVGLSISHHTDFFSNASNLPTFNSLSIESQFPFLSRVGAEFFLYLNDDTFLLGRDSLAATDVGAPILGPVFRLQTDLTVSSTAPGQRVLSPEGEWASLERSNWLLDQRFGKRDRHYLAHIPKAMSMPVLREIGLIWRQELDQTAASRFRGRDVEYQLPFLATHYTIESHRQALLLAYIADRIDEDGDGVLSLRERRRMLGELGFFNRKQRDGPPAARSEDSATRQFRSEDHPRESTVRVDAPYRTTRDDLVELFSSSREDDDERSRHRGPRSTRISCSSWDGHCPLRSRDNAAPVRYADHDSDETANEKTTHCEIDLEACFGGDMFSSSAARDDDNDETLFSTIRVFKEVSFRRPQCGDCMIVRLVANSGLAGLSAFLPSQGEATDTTVRLVSDDSGRRRRRRPFNLESAAGSPPVKDFESLTLGSDVESLPPSSSSSPPPPGSTTTTETRSIQRQRRTRVECAREILRYSYALGESKSKFFGMTSPRDTERVLKLVNDPDEVEEYEDLTFLTLNDDFPNDHVSQMSQPVLDDFFARTWPVPAPFEKT